MMMILRELKEEVRERRSNRRQEPASLRDYEERVTYKTITRTEFQRRRASFEGGVDGRVTWLKKKSSSLDELAGRGEEDPYHIQYQEKEMTEKLEDIHRMIVDMQEMTKQLKDRKYSRDEKLPVKAIGIISSTKTEDGGNHEKSLVISGPAMTVKPVRYRSTIVIVIGSQWQRFKEEIELKVYSRR